MSNTTAAGLAFLEMLEQERLQQVEGIDYQALKNEYSIDELTEYFVTNKDNLVQHDPKIKYAVEEYHRNMEPINKIGGTESRYLGRQMALRLLLNLGYGSNVSSSQFLDAGTINAKDPYWKEFGKKGKK